MTESAELPFREPSVSGAASPVFNLTPRARLCQDGTWVAKYAGLEHLIGRGATEDEAKERLVWSYIAWYNSGPRPERIAALAAASEFGDVEMRLIPISEAHELKSFLVGQCDEALGLAEANHDET